MFTHIAPSIIVSLDFDGVLAHGVKVKMRYAHEWFGVNLSLEQTKKPGFEALMKYLGKNINYRNLMDPLNEQHIMEYEVPEGCIGCLTGLHTLGYRFVVITSRNDHDYPYAVEFIKAKFGHLISFIHNTNDKTKCDFVRKLRPRVHLDDDLSKLEQLKTIPVELFYYRQPENSHIGLPLFESRIHEIVKWEQFYEYLMNLRLLHEAFSWKSNIPNNMFYSQKIIEETLKLSSHGKKELIREYLMRKP